jgi:class 3 adenylate cyclase
MSRAVARTMTRSSDAERDCGHRPLSDWLRPQGSVKVLGIGREHSRPIMPDIGSSLEQHGLGRYLDAFVANEIGIDDIADLTDADLRELGLPMGPRKRLLRVAARTDALARDRHDPDEIDDDLASQPLTGTGAAQRRQLTVIFCDLVGSTSLSESRDPEDYRELLAAYQAVATTAIRQHNGFIARFMGDGLLVYFGYPNAQEDDPERAARAGLANVEAIAALPGTTVLEVRVGIAIGPVMVGDIIGESASEETAVLGETPNLAARRQALAGTNTVLLSANTIELLRGRLEPQALEAVSLKGLSHPIVPHRARRARSASEVNEERLDYGPLVGREVELALLERAWRTARAAQGQAVLLSAEACVGKSRILRAFQYTIADRERMNVHWYCSPYHQTTANHPDIEEFQRALRMGGLDAAASLQRLERAVDALSLEVQTLVPVLAMLLSVPTGDRYPAQDYAPNELKRRNISAQIELLVRRQGKLPFCSSSRTCSGSIQQHWTSSAK